MSETLRRLASIIVSSIESLEHRFAVESIEFPSLDEPFDPSSKAEEIFLEPDMMMNVSVIAAAASQLIVTVRRPAQTVHDHGLSFNDSTCLRAAIESHMPEIVREAGAKGIHVKDVAAKSKTDPLKVARILRFLANNHIFREVSPDVFASNRLSSVLDSGKSYEQITSNPMEKYNGTNGVAAHIIIVVDEVMKGCTVLPGIFINPETTCSFAPEESPCSIAHNTPLSLFDWYGLPENDWRSKRFTIAMTGIADMEPPWSILQGFRWQDLLEGSKVVDVGGGVGDSSMLILQANPKLNIVVQDRPSVVSDAQVYWAKHMPEALENGRAQLQAYSFFGRQPIRDASVFLLRLILHDWADPYCKTILKHLRDAASSETKLIVVDAIMPYTCRAGVLDDIEGAKLPDSIPKELLPSRGRANNYAFQVDFEMYVYFNSQDRTLGHFVDLAAASGWKVVHVHRIPGTPLGQIVSVPAYRKPESQNKVTFQLTFPRQKK